jgi:uncharacterized protein YkwD
MSWLRYAVTIIAITGPLCAGGARAQAVQGRHGESVKGAEAKAEKDPKNPDLAAAGRRIVDDTNAFRKTEKAEPVVVNAKLTDAARHFAEFMAKTDEYGHEADGSTPAERAQKHGYEYCLVLENIAYAYSSAGFTAEELAVKFTEGWKNSPGHRKNMLDADVTETGVAIVRSEMSGYYYAVQMFGRPKSQAIAFEIANRTGATVSYAIGEEKFELQPRYVRTHQRCRREELTFTWPEGGGEPAMVKPAGGEQFVIAKEKDAYRIREEKAKRPK